MQIAPCPEAEPDKQEGHCFDENGMRVGNGDPGSPVSSLLILIHLIQVTYGCENLGPPGAVGSNGNLVLVVSNNRFVWEVPWAQLWWEESLGSPLPPLTEPVHGLGSQGRCCGPAQRGAVLQRALQ